MYRGLNPADLTLRDVLAYMEHYKGLIERDHENRKAAFAEPLVETVSEALKSFRR